MKKNTGKAFVFVYVPNEMKAKIEEHASYVRRPQSRVIREVLDKGFKEKDVERTKQQEQRKKDEEMWKYRRDYPLLKAENEALKTENKALKTENEALKGK